MPLSFGANSGWEGRGYCHQQLGCPRCRTKRPPCSSRSRLFLEQVRTAGFRFVLGDELMIEWKEHASIFSRQWLWSMRARKRVDRLRLVSDELFRTEILAAARTQGQAAEMSKDIHLLEAALQADCPIASLDDRARDLFNEASRTVRRLRPIPWVNPTKPDERAQEWLTAGAEAEPARCLGFGIED
jgi:hypothetical protein